MCVMQSTNVLYCKAFVKYQMAWEADGVVNRGEKRENTSDTSGILVMCLTGRQFGLQPRARLSRAPVLDLDGSSTHEEGASIRVNRDQGIRLIQIDANRKNALRFRRFQGEG